LQIFRQRRRLITDLRLQIADLIQMDGRCRPLKICNLKSLPSRSADAKAAETMSQE